jgi:hypothetical protein
MYSQGSSYYPRIATLFKSELYGPNSCVVGTTLCDNYVDDLEKQMPKGFFWKLGNPTSADNKANLVRNYFNFEGPITRN